jgi:hypothetical protein
MTSSRPTRRRGLVACVLIVLSCHAQNASDAVAPKPTGSGASVVAPKASGSSADPSTSPGPKADEINLTALVTEMREAIVKNDRERFARALIYPVKVNTDSRCRVLIPDPQAFLRHFEEIATPRVQRAIREAKADHEPATHRRMLGNGEVWLQRDDQRVVFNSGTWEVTSEPCDNWQVEPTPKWLNGTWVFAAVANADANANRLTLHRWQNASLRIDLEAGSASIVTTTGRARKCRPLRFGRAKNQPFSNRLDPSWHGYTAEEGRFFDLECDIKGAHGHVERIYVDSEISLIGNADDAEFVLFRPAGSVTLSAPAAKGLPCSSGANRCRPGLRCELIRAYDAAANHVTTRLSCE